MQNFLKGIKKYGLKVGLSIFLLLFLAFFWYVNDYYKADESVLTILDKAYVSEVNNVVELKADSNKGLIFYPGGKVEAYAYLALLDGLRNEGINVYLVKMPFNLAVFNINAADEIIKNHPEIEEWYIAGHSLGGAMASQYLEKNADKFSGLIQLAAYPINESEENTLVMIGSNDLVLSRDNIKDYVEIVGGNHAYFGDYGEQEGDGQASISRLDQQSFTINQIMDFITQTSSK